jgi:hypothetical protein
LKSIRLALTIVVCCLLVTSIRAESLLLDAPAPLKAKTTLAKRQRFVKINPTVATTLTTPGTQFDLSLFDGKQFTLQVDKVTDTSSNSFAIRCSVPGQPWNYMVMTRQNGAFAGSFHAGENLYQIESTGTDIHTLREADTNVVIKCGVAGKTPPTPVFSTAVEPVNPSASVPVNQMSAARIASLAPNKLTLDVLVVYTPAVVTRYGSEDAVVSAIKLSMAEGQLALDNSQVNVQVRLVHTELVNYTESGNLNTDLNHLGNPSDGFADSANALRDKYKADILSMWVDQSTGGIAGLGFQLLPNVTLYTYNVIWAQYATGTYVPIHEIGHNFGCDHEPAYSVPQPLYPYAHGYIFQTPAGATKTTVMTAVSDSRRIPYFSNPNVFYDDGSGAVPVGSTNANNALVMNNSAAKLTSFRVPPGLGEALDAPKITWTTGGDSQWFWQPNNTHDNSDAAQSGPILANQSTWLQGIASGPARLSYWWSMSTESGGDYVSFYIDDVQQWSESGDGPWFHEVAFIPPGSHTIKWVYSKNGDTDAGQDAAWVDQVSVTPVKLPTVTITAPTINARIFSSTTNVTGTAHDDTAVDHVEYQLRNAAGTTGWQTASGTTTWSAPISMVAGTNTITVRSVGFGGQISLPVSRSFFYVVTNQLTVITNGAGSIAPNMNGKFLEIGRPYTITAKASNNWLFSSWSGSVVSTNPALTFLMQSNMVLQGNFVTNPFLPHLGVYNGVFHQSPVTTSNAGFITFTLAKAGTYSGKMTLEGLVYTLNGRFDLNGESHLVVPRLHTNSVSIDLAMNFANDSMGGLVSTLTWGSGVIMGHNPFDAVKNKATAFAGKYTVAFSGSNDSHVAPAGDSIATVTIDAGGNVHATGTLADGTAFTQTVGIDANGNWPLFVPLYSNKGLLLGDCGFDSASGTVSGQVTWIKPSFKTTYYSNGFSLTSPLVGSTFVTPSNGVRVLNFTNGTVTLSSANLPFTIQNPVLLNSNNTVTVTGTNGTALTINKVTGALTGSHFTDPVTHAPVLINGVVLQKQNDARGFFKGTNQTGEVLLQGD